MAIVLRHIFSVGVFLLLTGKLLAQQEHFVYIQTENSQPFYVKMDKKLLSSTGTGYLIIGKLVSGTYDISIGFPKQEIEEQQFAIAIDNKDKGYSLKNFGDKGWGLFNLQSMEIIMSVHKTAAVGDNKEMKDDAFSSLLSAVVNDPGIRQKEVQRDEPVIEIRKDSVQVLKEPGIVKKDLDKKSGGTKITARKKAYIFKLASNSTDRGIEMVFVDKSSPKPDTIRVFIEPMFPVSTDQVISKEVMPPHENRDTLAKPEVIKEVPIVEVKKEEIKKEDKVIVTELPPTSIIKDTGVITDEKRVKETIPVPNKTQPVPVMINSDCRNFASDDDFLKLRKKMASFSSDDDMIIAAKKIFKNKCFTTEQIKNLSVLFLKDEGKYRFFDTAYPFVSDSNNYPSLEPQLTDTYFINRFKVMIKH